jgi:hypothetical protein
MMVEDVPAMTLEIATPHDKVVELRVEGPLGDDGGDVVTWTLAAIPASSVVVLDLTRAQIVVGGADRWIRDSLCDLARRRVRAVVVLSREAAGKLTPSSAVVLSDLQAARDHATRLAEP